MDPTLSTLEMEATYVNDMFSPQPSISNMEYLIVNSLRLLFALVGLAGNSVVLWLLSFHIRRNTFHTYILNLAGADFLFLCFQIIYSLGRFTFFSIPDFCISLWTFAYLSSLSILSAISTERCLSVLFPIWYHCRRPKRMSAVMCALLWALSLLLSILEGKYCDFLFQNYNHDLCQEFDFLTAAWLIFLFVLLSWTSLALLLRLQCGSQRMQLTRMYLTIGLTVLVFLLFGLPWGIHWFLVIWLQIEFNVFFDYASVLVLLSCVNSCTNPFIYFFVGSYRKQRQQRRPTFKLILQRALQDDLEEDQGEGSHPQETLEMSGRSEMS
nr:TPA: Mas-related G protein-coupled receptor G1 [Erinaceus europaeus]